MRKAFLALLILLLLSPAKADVITEFGMGYKVPTTTSVVMLPSCHIVRLTGPIYNDPDSDHYGREYASCGGDDPIFVGWPIAYQSDFKDEIWMVRAGWYHFSHWFDGGQDRELHMDAVAVTTTFNWTKFFEKRKRKHGN